MSGKEPTQQTGGNGKAPKYDTLERGIMARTDLNWTAKGLLMVLQRYRDKSERFNDDIYPGITTLSRDMGVHRATILRAIDELVEAGFVTVQRSKHHLKGKRKNRPNRYRLRSNVSKPPPPNGSKMRPEGTPIEPPTTPEASRKPEPPQESKPVPRPDGGGDGGFQPKEPPEEKTPERPLRPERNALVDEALQAAGIKDPGVLAELAAIPEITPAVIELAATEARNRPGVVVKILRDPDHRAKLIESAHELQTAREAPARDMTRRQTKNREIQANLEREANEREWAKWYFAGMTASQQAAILQQAYGKTPNFARRLLLWKIPKEPFQNKLFRGYAMQAMKDHGFTMGYPEESQTIPFPGPSGDDRTPEGTTDTQNRLEADCGASAVKVG